MQAIVVEHREERGALREVPKPQPKAHELLVQVSAASVNPIDWKVRDAGRKPFPFILGQDFAGVVSGIGDGVEGFVEGDRVFGIARSHGAYAQFTVVPASSNEEPVAHIPDDVGDADAAALPTAGLTALAALDVLRVARGTNLAIFGVTGGVGGFAAQMARSRGANVIGTASAAHEERAHQLGVSSFIAYDRDDELARIRQLAPGGVDAVLDLVHGPDRAGDDLQIMRPGAAIVSTIGALDVEACRARGFTADNLVMNQTPQSSHEGLRTLARMLEEGTIDVRIDAERDLRDALQLLDISREGSATGKLVVTIETGRT